MKHTAALHAIGYRGWQDGSAAILEVVQNWDIQNSRSTGGRFACISSASKAVPLRPPVMCLVAALGSSEGVWWPLQSLLTFVSVVICMEVHTTHLTCRLRW